MVYTTWGANPRSFSTLVLFNSVKPICHRFYTVRTGNLSRRKTFLQFKLV